MMQIWSLKPIEWRHTWATGNSSSTGAVGNTRRLRVLWEWLLLLMVLLMRLLLLGLGLLLTIVFPTAGLRTKRLLPALSLMGIYLSRRALVLMILKPWWRRCLWLIKSPCLAAYRSTRCRALYRWRKRLC